MSDDQRAAGAESHPETPPPAPPKNPFPVPPSTREGAAALAPAWSEGQQTRLVVRGGFWVDLRPQLLVQETRYLGKETKKGDDVAGLRELACYLVDWSFTYVTGPRKGEVMTLPAYDPYGTAIAREKEIQARLQLMDYLTTDDLSTAIERLQWLRWEVAQQYDVPPVASAPATTTSTPSASVSG